jgi:hypothetical protein
MRNEISSSKEERNRPPVMLRHKKSRGKRHQSIDINIEKQPGQTASKKETKLAASG